MHFIFKEDISLLSFILCSNKSELFLKNQNFEILTTIGNYSNVEALIKKN